MYVKCINNMGDHGKLVKDKIYKVIRYSTICGKQAILVGEYEWYAWRFKELSNAEIVVAMGKGEI